jgi:hypothetical protein
MFSIARIKTTRKQLGAGIAHAYDYKQFMAFVEKVKRVHELNPDIIIFNTFGHPGLGATVQGVETPKEYKQRLRARLTLLKRDLTMAKADAVRRDDKAEEMNRHIRELEQVIAEKLSTKKPAAKRKRPRRK